LKINKIEDIIRQYSVDCVLNKYIHNQDKVDMKIINSIDETEVISIEKEQQQCKQSIIKNIDYSKVSENMLLLDIINTSYIIKKIISENNIFHFNKGILYEKYESQLIDYTLLYMVRNKVQILMKNNVRGYLIQHNEKYSFQPYEIDDMKISLNERKQSKKPYIRKYILSELAENNGSNTNIDDTQNTINNYMNEYDMLIKKLSIVPKLNNEIVMDIVVDSIKMKDYKRIFLNIDEIKEKHTKMYESLKRGNYIHEDNIFYDIYEKKFYEKDKTCAYTKCTKIKDKLIDKFNKDDIDVLGFVETVKKTNECVVKIKHLEQKNKNISGSACIQTSTFTKKLMQKYINVYEDKIDLQQNISKPLLCTIYEYVLRKENKFSRPIRYILTKKN
jgi:hypothetical protein